MDKKGAAILARLLSPDIWVIVIVALFIYFGFFYSGTIIGRDCNLGSWHVSNYDAVQKTLTISYSSSGQAGCVGSYDVSSWDRGGMGISTKTECESFGLSWTNENVCIISDGWFNDKKVTSSSGGCTIYCGDARGCGGCQLAFGGSRLLEGSASFDGYKIDIPFNQCSLGITQSCSGTISIGPVAQQLPIDNSNNNVNNTSQQEPTNNQEPSVTLKEKSGFFDSIARFIQNILDKIASLFN